MNTLNINFKFFNPQKAHPCARPRRLSHRTQKSAEGSNLGEFLKKGIWLQKFLRIFHLFAEKPPPVQIYMQFCVRGHLADVINRADIYLNQVTGFDSVGVEFLAFP